MAEIGSGVDDIFFLSFILGIPRILHGVQGIAWCAIAQIPTIHLIHDLLF